MRMRPENGNLGVGAGLDARVINSLGKFRERELYSLFTSFPIAAAAMQCR